MITTELYEGQGLGNQLWVYAVCRSIAEHLNYPFAILGQNRFKGHSFLDLDFGQHGELEGGTVFTHENVRSVFRERMFYDPGLDYISSSFDESVSSLAPYTRIEGLFQSERYFFGDLSRIRAYIKIKEESLALTSIPEEVCILNIRGGEYKRHKRFILPKSYWLNAMQNMKSLTGVRSFLIVTDDPRYAKSLLPGIPVLQGSIAECYIAIHHAKHLIISNSSFPYFPIKTGREDRVIIAPKHWARFGNDYSRWASPANLYTSWLWQDAKGLLHSYADCQQEQLDTEAYYRTHYTLSTLPSAVMHPGVRGYFPSWLKKPIKKGLSFIFPRHIG